MKFGKIFGKAHLNQSGVLSQDDSPSRWHTIPVFVPILFSLFAGLAFSPLADIPFSKKDMPPVVIEVKPTPTSYDPSVGTKTSLQSSSSILEVLPPVESDLDFVSYRYHSWDIPDEVTGGSDFWMEIDLTNQMLYAYRDNQLISGFKVSTGTSSHKTVTGTFKIFSKYPAITMSGPGYNLPDVPYSMFFYKGYSIHGTYWHHNFGTPMSHGCVNMNTVDAAWIYANAPVGTYIMVHY
ncbi:MAG: L,D-transpeptidase family protein [Pelolinea sp.]|nr:L,D-transpeptidase family protein [Pelolinea sp.]